jgi:ABC-type phosphate transport system substrate-binding protein
MRLFSARRAITACAVTAVAVAAAAAPGAASAATQCSGTSTFGAGSSAQKQIQKEFWTVKFNTSGDAHACNGTQGSGAKPTVTYESVGSGAGLEKWSVNGHAFEMGKYAYVGTDEPVDAKQKTEIEKNETGSAPESVQSVPVLQFAITVPVNLPAGCVATSTGAPGRLVMSNQTLQGIFAGTIKTWKAYVEAEATNKSGDAITGEGCNTESTINVVVRHDQSGTTHVFKKYLALINGAALETELATKETWAQLSEGPASTDWPAATKVLKPTENGNGPVAALIAATPSSLGYVNLADARKNGNFSTTGKGGPTTGKFWVEIEHNGAKGVKSKGIKAADPSTNGDAEALANSNCANEKYTNGAGTKFPPKTTAATWNEVTTETKQKGYPICGLTYDMVVSKYSAYPGTTEGEAITANNYLQYEVSTGAEGGQAQAFNTDYEPLPKNLIKEAQKGAALAAF